MAPRRRSPSEEFSSGSPEPRERLRASWFDVTPEMVASGTAGRTEEGVRDAILAHTGGKEAAPPEKAGAQLQQATRHARRIYVGGLPPSANEERISSFFSSALAAIGGAPTRAGPLRVHHAGPDFCAPSLDAWRSCEADRRISRLLRPALLPRSH